MKRFLMLTSAVLFALFCVIGQASALDQIDLSGLEESAPDELAELDLNASDLLGEGLNTIWEAVRNRISEIISDVIGNGLRLLTVVLFCALAESIAVGESKRVVTLAGTAGVSLLALTDLDALIGLGRETILSLSDFSGVLFPVLTSASVLTGGAVSAPARQVATLFCSHLLTRLISQVLLPLTYTYAAVTVAASVLGQKRIQPLARLIRWVIVTLLTGVLLLFVAYLAVSGAINSTADAATIRATRLAISGMVPVVGGILSDATETVLSGASLLRSSVGVFGMLGVLGFCLTPFLRLGVQFLLYQLVAALSAVLSDTPVVTLIQDLSGVFALVMAMTGSCALVTLIGTISAISAAVP